MWAAVHVAQEMGARLGQREVLQQKMSRAQKRVIRYSQGIPFRIVMNDTKR
jgi:hypothetical protein